MVQAWRTFREHWKKRHSLLREKEDQERQDKEDQERQDKEDQESGLGQSRDKRRAEQRKAEQQAAGEKRKQEQSHQEAKVRRLEENKKEEISLLDFTREVLEFMLEKQKRGLETSATPRFSKAGQEVMRYENIGHLIILSNPTIKGRCAHCSGRSRYTVGARSAMLPFTLTASMITMSRPEGQKCH